MMDKKQMIKDFFKAETNEGEYFAFFPRAFNIVKRLGNLIEGKDYEFKEGKYHLFLT